jgi:hypothetical protein
MESKMVMFKFFTRKIKFRNILTQNSAGDWRVNKGRLLLGHQVGNSQCSGLVDGAM